jgi:crotonobetainyl-CoA:carnitine CoA-transferase CaiB-like acyl-CoA transferase
MTATESTTLRGPLAGVRVIDAATMIAGPYGATLLGDLGADVIKVEPLYGDDLRRLGAARDGETGSYTGINRSKRGIALDLAAPLGRAVFARLAATADALVTNTREPALSRLGLDYESVRSHRADVIWVGVSTFGPDGPYAGLPGIDSVAQALAGVIALNGAPGSEPVRTVVPFADVMTSLLVATGIAAALHERAASGEGQRIDVSLLNALVHAQANALGNYFVSGWVLPRTGNRSPYFAPAGAYACADGAAVYLTCPSDRFFSKLCRALAAEWDTDPRFLTAGLRLQNEDALDAEITACCARMTRAALLERLARGDVPAAAVNGLADVVRDPQILHNRMIVRTQHPALGQLDVTGVPIRFGRTPGSVHSAPPTLGQHTDEILVELGFDAGQRREIVASGAVGVRRGEQ